MPKFRKKPVVIEAVRLPSKLADLPTWTDTPDVIFRHIGDGVTDEALINTLEGTMTASAGDWIIKGIAGELYPCKPDIFDATYEPVDEKAG